MTYNVFGGTLSLTRSINQSCVKLHKTVCCTYIYRFISKNGNIALTTRCLFLNNNLIQVSFAALSGQLHAITT